MHFETVCRYVTLQSGPLLQTYELRIGGLNATEVSDLKTISPFYPANSEVQKFGAWSVNFRLSDCECTSTGTNYKFLIVDEGEKFSSSTECSAYFQMPTTQMQWWHYLLSIRLLHSSLELRAGATKLHFMIAMRVICNFNPTIQTLCHFCPTHGCWKNRILVILVL